MLALAITPCLNTLTPSLQNRTAALLTGEITCGKGHTQTCVEASDGQNVIKAASSHEQSRDTFFNPVASFLQKEHGRHHNGWRHSTYDKTEQPGIRCCGQKKLLTMTTSGFVTMPPSSMPLKARLWMTAVFQTVQKHQTRNRNTESSTKHCSLKHIHGQSVYNDLGCLKCMHHERY